MKKIIFAAAAIALFPVTAQAQLLGGGGLGGGLGGSLGGSLGGTLDNSVGGSIGGTLDRTTRTVRGSVDGTGSTDGSQSVDARRGTVSANRSANGSITGSTASLADVVVPTASQMATMSGSGAANGQGSANAQLIGTDAVTGAVAPLVQGARSRAGEAVSGIRNMNAPTGGAASGSGAGSVGGSLMSSPLAVAGSAAAAGERVAAVSRGMPVMTREGASLGKVSQMVANSRGEIQQVVVKQGKVTRELPTGMFSASGDALVLTQASGAASAEGKNNAEPAE